MQKLLLHNLVQVCDSDEQFLLTQRSEAEAEGKESEAGGKQPAGPLADWLAPDFPIRFGSALRTLIVPKVHGDETVMLRIGEWIQTEVMAGRAPGETLTKAVLERAAKARKDGRKPMALFTQLLRDELGYNR